jgi:hypothetical protein
LLIIYTEPFAKEDGHMKKVLFLVFAFMIIAVTASAAGSKTYMLTGTVTDLKGDVFTVQKDSAKYEMTRDATAKVNGELKVGSKVTVIYKMTATTIVVTAEAKK